MKAFYIILFGAFLINVGCNKNSSNGIKDNNATSYYLNNGSCYSSTTGQVVTANYCNSVCNNSNTTNGYYWNNNSCYASATGQIVEATYCSSACNNGINGNNLNNGFYINNGYCYSSSTG